MKVALVHEFLTQYGGAERVLDAFLEIWPEAQVYTLIYDKRKIGRFYGKYNVKSSILEKLPSFPPAGYKWWLPFYPKAIESFRFDDYDLVLSDSSAFAKGVITRKPTTHICYMHTPTRYLWNVTKEYLRDAPIPGVLRPLMPPVLKYLRKWDFQAAQRPEYIIANSDNIARRIKKFYNRDADEVIFPYVDTSRFKISTKPKKYWLVVGRQEPYKRTDLAISAANKLGYDLIVAGSGTNIKRYTELAGPNIRFTGRIDDEELARLFEDCIGMIFPQEEDAGITPLEAMAAGRPVLAYKAGGALETVIPDVTGEFFDEQNVDTLASAMKKFDESKYDSQIIRNHAEKFDKEKFKLKILNFVLSKVKKI